MAKISTYANVSSISLSDRLIGTDVNNSDVTKNFPISAILSLPFPYVPVYIDNADALANGLIAGNIYRITGTDYMGVVH
jgi:hypothetical protein